MVVNKPKTKVEPKTGHWEWNNETTQLVFVPTEVVTVVEAHSLVDVKQRNFSRGLAYEVLHFRDILNEVETAAFERAGRRKSNYQQLPVITLLDIKDLVLFLVIEPLPTYFLTFFNTEKVQHWLRGVIVYMHFFTETCEELMSTINLLRGPPPLEGPPRYMVMNQELAEMRFVVGRQHSILVMSALGSGAGRAFKKGNSRDVELFELLMQLAIHIVWIALSRRYHSIIDKEMNRIFRTSAFSMKFTKRQPGEISDNFINAKTRDILYGHPIEGLDCFGNLKLAQVEKQRTMLQNSPVFQDFQAIEDNGLLQIGMPKFNTNNERLKFLTKCFYGREEELQLGCINVGILGQRRSEFDVSLHPIINKSNDDVKSRSSVPNGSKKFTPKTSIESIPLGSNTVLLES